MTVSLTLSNIGAADRTVRITERIPVSEVEEVRVTVDDKRTTAGMTFDAASGFCRWDYPIPGNTSAVLTLRWRLSVSPGVAAPV